jgi:hypothetical protein
MTSRVWVPSGIQPSETVVRSARTGTMEADAEPQELLLVG